MRMTSNCYICILERAIFECDLHSLPEDLRLAVIEELLDFMVSHKRDVPARVGTERELIVKRISGIADPYRCLKEESNAVARDLIEIAERFYEESGDRIEALVRIAAAANSMEFGVMGHNFDNRSFAKVFEDTLSEELKGGSECDQGDVIQLFEHILPDRQRGRVSLRSLRNREAQGDGKARCNRTQI